MKYLTAIKNVLDLIGGYTISESKVIGVLVRD